MTGRRDATAGRFGRRGEETHARSAAWGYGADRDATSARGFAGGREGAKVLKRREEVRGKKEREKRDEFQRESCGPGFKKKKRRGKYK